MRKSMMVFIILAVVMLMTACIQQLDEEKALQQPETAAPTEPTSPSTETQPSAPETPPQETVTPTPTTPEETAPAEQTAPAETATTEPTPPETSETVPEESAMTAVGDTKDEQDAAAMVNEYLTLRKEGDIDNLYTYYVFNNGGYTEENPQVQAGIINRIKGSNGLYALTDYEMLSSKKITDQEFIQYYIKYTFDRFGKFWLGYDLYLVRVRVTTDPADVGEKLNKDFYPDDTGVSYFFVVKKEGAYKLIYTDTQISFHQVV